MRRVLILGLSCVLAGSFTAPVTADTLSGSYLSARHADNMNDYAAATQFFNKVLTYDSDSASLHNDAVMAFIMRGDFEAALDWIDAPDNRNEMSRMSRLITLTQAIRAGYWDDAANFLKQDAPLMSPLTVDLLGGWIAAGQGDQAQAQSLFDELGREGLGLVGQYHKALAYALDGDLTSALDIMDGDAAGPLHLDRVSIAAHAKMAAAAGDSARAIEIIQNADPNGTDLTLAGLLSDLQTGGSVGFDTVISAQEGTAEVYRMLANLLSTEDNSDASLIYARLSQFLNPDQADVNLVIGDILRQRENFVLASEELSKVDTKHPLFPVAEMTRADALADAGEVEASIEVLQGLSRQLPDRADVRVSIGDVLRMEKRFDEAEGHYTKALDLMDASSEDAWRVHYVRGITRERTDQWPLAEQDFRRSLELEPDQPFVLNYLGYSLVEQNRNLDEALQMIRTAVEQLPEDGYITDSLGWAYYRLGRYQEAVEPMERAASLVATDPIINDHLGDVYWMVDRKREARFQWRRALSFKPDAEEVPKIRRKLEIGLDAFLEEEEARETASTD
ncbi:MAG: tetratricopeptide repeat protein [Pseudomonadota bacterium]